MAGLGRKEFNSGDILLASEVQGYLQDQAVMVFDDATARGSAIPSPSEGMLTYNKDTSGLELYDGSAFGPVGSDSGLIHIKTVSDSGVAAISVTDVFSSQYQNYVAFCNWVNSGTNQINIRFRTASDDNSANYGSSAFLLSSANVTTTLGTSAGTSFIVEPSGAILGAATFNFYDPNTTAASRYTMIRDRNGINISSGRLDTSTQYTGFTFFPFAGTTTATIRVYGVING